MKSKFLAILVCMSIFPNLVYAGGKDSADSAASSSVTLSSSSAPGSSPGSSAPPASHSQPVNEHGNFVQEQMKKIKAEEAEAAKKAATAKLFNNKDKPLVNSILKNIMRIIESEKNGIAKVRIAANHLKRLQEIHKEYEVGTARKEDALAALKMQVKSDLARVEAQPKYEISPLQMEAELNSLTQEKFDAATTDLLRDFYMDEYGKISAYGMKVGGAGLIGVELGAHAGKIVSATGKRYAVVCVTFCADLGAGAVVGFGHFFGKIKMSTDSFHFATERMGMPVDTFIAGKSNARETAPGAGVQLKEYTFVTGIRGGSMGVTKPFKLFPIPGRDYKYLREKLGLIPN